MSPEQFDQATVYQHLKDIQARRARDEAEKDRIARDEAMARLVRMRQTLIDEGRLPSNLCQCVETCCRACLELRHSPHWK
jgi:hypothetical protein